MARRNALIAVLALAVVLAHWAILAGLRIQGPPRVLQAQAAPMFTRMLLPQPPAAMPQAVATVRRAAAPSQPPKPAQRPAPAPVAEPVVASAPVVTETLVLFPPTDAHVSSVQQVASAQPTAIAVASAPPAPPASTDSWPADTRLTYRLGGQYRGELHGDARVQWQRRGDRYQARVEIDVGLLASLVLTSQGVASSIGLLPAAYEEDRRGKTRGVRLDESQITFADGRTVPRPAGVQDTASQFIELAHRFATGQSALEVGKSVEFWMSRPGAVDLWTYDIVDKEMLTTPRLGQVEAWHLKPRPIANPRGNITAEMWFAPSLQYLPVRIRVNMSDTVFVDLMIDKIEQR